MSIMRIGILARAVAFIADSDVTVLWDGSLQAGPPGGSPRRPEVPDDRTDDAGTRAARWT